MNSVYLKASICSKAVEFCGLCVEILVACEAGESFCHNPEPFSCLQIDAGVCRRRRGVLQGVRHKEGHRVVVLRGLAWKSAYTNDLQNSHYWVFWPLLGTFLQVHCIDNFFPDYKKVVKYNLGLLLSFQTLQRQPIIISQLSITNTRDLPCLKLDGSEVKIDKYWHKISVHFQYLFQNVWFLRKWIKNLQKVKILSPHIGWSGLQTGRKMAPTVVMKKIYKKCINCLGYFSRINYGWWWFTKLFLAKLIVKFLCKFYDFLSDSFFWGFLSITFIGAFQQIGNQHEFLPFANAPKNCIFSKILCM